MRKFVPVEQLGTEGEERHSVNPSIVDERIAILGDDGKVKIVYPSHCQQDKEADYMVKLKNVPGVPVLFEEGDMYNIIQRLYPLPSGEYSRDVICTLCFQLVSLVEELYMRDVIHGHFRYFVMHDGEQVYFTDNVFYTCIDRGNIRRELWTILDLLRAHSSSFIVDELEEIVQSRGRSKRKFDQMKDLCMSYSHKADGKLRWKI